MIERADDSFEICRILSELNFDGQRTLVTPESFAKPNIQLVYRILKWFLEILKLSPAVNHPTFRGNKFDPTDATNQYIDEYPPHEASRASDYVKFFVHTGHFCNRLLGIKLDLVALCRADKTSCSELLKVAVPIFNAAKLVVKEEAKLTKSGDWFEHELEARQKCLSELFVYASQDDNIDQLASSCSLLSEELQAQLKDEEKHNSERVTVIDRQLELKDIERVLADSLSGIKQETDHLKRINIELEQDLLRLDGKLALKETEISEARRKLSELLLRSPSYANQYEALEKRYETAYERYISSYRNLAYLKMCVYSGNSVSSSNVVADQSDNSNNCLDDDWWCSEDDKSYQDWLRRHQTGVKWWGSVSKSGDHSQADPLGASKKSLDASATTLLVFDADKGPATSAARLLAGSETVGPARLLESLLDVVGTSKPISASLTTAGPTAPDRVDAQGATVVDGWAGTGLDRERSGVAGATAGNRRLSGLVDTGLELEGLLDEFAPDDSTKLATEVDNGSDEDEDDDDDDDAGDDDEEEEEEEEEENEDDDLIG